MFTSNIKKGLGLLHHVGKNKGGIGKQLQMYGQHQLRFQSSKCDPGLVIFDKDGTLIDFNLMWGGWVESQAWKLEMTCNLPVREKLFDAMGYDWIQRSVKSQGALCCTPMGHLYKLAVQVLLDSGVQHDRAEDIIAQIWSLPDPITLARPLGNLTALFKTIKQMNMKIAICTTDNRKATIETIRHLQLDSMVDAYSCGDDGLPPKPAPEQIWNICKELNVEPHNTVMVGDTNTDMTLGRNASCGLSVGIMGGASSVEDLGVSADVLVPDLTKLVKILFQFGQQARKDKIFASR